MTFKPMLAATAKISDIKFPVAASVKLDGMRCVVFNNMPMTRSMKPVRNKHTQEIFKTLPQIYSGFDGELIVGEPNHPKVFHNTSSSLNTIEGEPEFTFYVFDNANIDDDYLKRYNKVKTIREETPVDWVKILPIHFCENPKELEEFEEQALEDGYEGLIVRSLDGRYKQNRSTLKEGGMLKIKRFEDNEAVIVDFEQRMHNNNEAKINELGYTQRSSNKDNLIPEDTLGKFVVRGLNGIFKEKVFKIGSGFDDQQAKHIWENKAKYEGAIVKYKHFPVGVKDLPRHPVWLGFRDKTDFD